jgi:uncharacterized protein YdaT
MANLSKFGNYLVLQGYFDLDTVSQATKKMAEYGENSPSSLAKILEDEFKANHDLVYEALAKHYAFPKLEVAIEDIDHPER